MKILHISDTHGNMWTPRHFDADVVVHSGDFFPSFSRGVRAIEEGKQRAWLLNEAKRIKRVVGDRPLVFCAGNHDYLDPATILGAHGVNVKNITNGFAFVHVSGESVRFDGFPYVNRLDGEWNYEVNEPEMRARVDRLAMRLVADSVLVTHGPAYGVLDRVRGVNVGSKALGSLVVTLQPRAHLHGHIHEANGMQLVGRTLVSNAATAGRVIEL